MKLIKLTDEIGNKVLVNSDAIMIVGRTPTNTTCIRIACCGKEVLFWVLETPEQIYRIINKKTRTK